MYKLFSKVLVLRTGEQLDRALGILDRTMSVETHKIGILYMAPGNTTQEEILANQVGSPRFHKVVLRKSNLIVSF